MDSGSRKWLLWLVGDLKGKKMKGLEFNLPRKEFWGRGMG